MANPKYADLPGIARDQPDVYETNDLPESDQSHSIAEAVLDQSDSVEPITLTATEAYGRFKGKSLDAQNVDFTDSISRKRRIGYEVRSGDWEMLDHASKDEETPLQAYNRLQFEVKELLEKVRDMKEIPEDKQMPPVALMEQIQIIQKDLQDLHLEQVLGSEAIKDMSDPLSSLHNKLLTQMENFKKVSVGEKKPKSAASKTSPSDVMTYELYVKPEHSKLEETAKTAELEQRLKNLESIVGQDRSKISFLTSSTDEKTIVAALNLLTSKLNLLDPAYLDQIENRLAVLHQCMQQVAEKKLQTEEAEKLNKVSELYELAKKVEGMSSGLPQVVERLVALKELHEQALQFSKALTQLDTAQQQLSNSVHNNETLLKKVQETFVKNNEVIEKNMSSLKARIEALQK